MGLQRVRHDWSDLAHVCTRIHTTKLLRDRTGCISSSSQRLCGWGKLRISLRFLPYLRSLMSGSDLSSCCMRAQWLWLLGSRAQPQYLWCSSLAASWNVGSSQIKDQTHVSCTNRQILYHCAPRETPVWWWCFPNVSEKNKSYPEITIWVSKRNDSERGFWDSLLLFSGVLRICSEVWTQPHSLHWEVLD